MITSSKLYEVQKYIRATNHAYLTPIVLVSKKFWDKLRNLDRSMVLLNDVVQVL